MDIPIMGMLTGILINLIFWTAFVLSVHSIVKYRNRERMALIEKGVDLSTLYDKKEKSNQNMKWGMLFIGLALGVLAGFFLTELGLNPVISFVCMILLFAGGSLILFHRYNSKQVTD